MSAAPDLARWARGLAPIAAFLRGGGDRVETLHLGAAAVVTGDGETLLPPGDPGLEFPLRSTAKPFQLLPFLLDGLHRREPPLSPPDLAIMMSSHSGEPMHTARVAALLERAGLSPDDLRCGVHPPMHGPTRDAMLREGRAPGPLHCNCSGKHAAMLALCRARGWPLSSYLEPSHPLQQRVAELIVELAGRAHGQRLAHSVDGCSLPTWWLTLPELARMFARIAAASASPGEGGDVDASLALLYHAGTAHPELVAGNDRLDTLLMGACESRVFAKTGADGLYAMAVAPRDGLPRGAGIAFKVADGDPESRVRAAVAVELLRWLGVLDDVPGITARLGWAGDATRRNHRGIEVGRLRTLLELPARPAG